MNILLINHYAGSPRYGMEYRPYYLAREWVKMGHRVTIVAASFSHLHSCQPTIKGIITREEIEEINYLWLKTPSYHGNGIKRMFNMLTFVLRLFDVRKKLLKDFKPDVVIASSTYPLDIYPANFISKACGSKLIFEVHDLWPLSPMELGGMSRYHPFIIVLQHAEDFACQFADKVVSILPKADSYLHGRGMSPYKFVYIPNGIDVDEWQQNFTPLPQLHSDALKRIRQDDRFIIGYAGAHGLSNALDIFIDAASLLQDISISFVLVGQGPEKERLQQKTLERGLQNVIFLPPVQKASIPELLNRMDVLYIGLKKQSLFRFGVSPNKLMDYMMAGKPVIHAIDAGNDMVAESGCGISVPPEDPQAVADAVKRLMDMSEDERKAMGQKGKEYVVAHHDYRVLAKRFLEVI